MKNKEIVVSCPIKEDNEYLKEFVDHYLKLGFDRIYLYDNNDDENIKPYNLLLPYIKRNKVEIIDWRKSEFDDRYHRLDFFLFCNFEWVLFVDDDEFLELRKHKNIRDFLSSMDKSATKIAFNNLHYGDNDQYYFEQRPVQERFLNPLPLDSGTGSFKFNSAIKSFLKKKKLRSIYDLNAHSLIDESPYYNANNKKIELETTWRMKEEYVSYDTAYIKHYCTKSLEEFVKCKIKRTVSNSNKFKNRFDIDSYFYMYNKRTKEKDELFKVFMKKYL